MELKTLLLIKRNSIVALLTPPYLLSLMLLHSQDISPLPSGVCKTSIPHKVRNKEGTCLKI